MSITALLLSSWLMSSVSTVQLSELQSLSTSEPEKALKLYEQLLKLAQKEADQEAVVTLYLEGVLAALNARDWSTFTTIVEQLYSADLSVFMGPVQFNLLTRIGVAYRYNNQLEQARIHYKCALRQSASDLELTLLKVNLAIVYRLSDQPAMAFQLISSIDEHQLSTKVKAGYSVVRGNTLAAMGEHVRALSYFEKAHLLYVKNKDRRAEVLIQLNIMSAALAQQSFDKFSKYRKGYELLLHQHGLKPPLFLQWLDLIEKVMKSGRMTLEDEKWVKNNVIELSEQGYGMGIKAHLTTIEAMHLYPTRPPSRQGENALPEFLGKPWCSAL
ncbi:hypothetical protein PSECIP111854_01183 [Pseudoalteromonas sp. CIP111854]|uniref:Tetratricopeptide repeat protein n=1 Tax=Pseudoalteromonas holothuriae TaxID=2963714 RepID=A0A9W4QUD2_9GAMM|nr:hypothetical protein [Pseudoalteromonas sp. CIP111854]CAH9053507.1 hypothetical protein PSECIP111854_01183 [Pseudoalteromonas sp. CIP111854]